MKQLQPSHWRQPRALARQTDASTAAGQTRLSIVVDPVVAMPSPNAAKLQPTSIRPPTASTQTVNMTADAHAALRMRFLCQQLIRW